MVSLFNMLTEHVLYFVAKRCKKHMKTSILVQSSRIDLGALSILRLPYASLPSHPCCIHGVPRGPSDGELHQLTMSFGSPWSTYCGAQEALCEISMCGSTIFSAWEISHTSLIVTSYSHIDHYHYEGVSINGLLACDCYPTSAVS